MSESDRIVRCAIHPAIGISRVGNAPPDDFYLAPEIPGHPADPGPSGYKTPAGEIRREAARFRVYGYDEAGEVVQEITAADAEIVWEVHLANRKAAWYQFLNALDLKQFAMTPTFRNATVAGAQRDDLVIDPGPRNGSAVRTGTAPSTPSIRAGSPSRRAIPSSCPWARSAPTRRAA